MVYTIHYKFEPGKFKTPGTIQTYDGKVVYATPAMQWSITLPIGKVLSSLQDMGCTVTVQEQGVENARNTNIVGH